MPIVVTDPTPVPPDERCPQCGAGRKERIRSRTFGPVHDVCSVCFHDFVELTVPEEPEDDAS